MIRKIHSPRVASPRCASPRMQRPGSPRANFSKKSRILSPFQRITSPQSIGNSILPSFMRLTQPTADCILNNIPLAKAKTADTSTAELSKYKQSPIVENIAGKVDHPGDFINYVFDAKLNPEQILLRVGKVELSRKDLSCLRPGKLLPINLIDACLSCIKKKNKKIFQKQGTHKRVIIVKTGFAQKVLQSKEKIAIRSKKNLLNFE